MVFSFKPPFFCLLGFLFHTNTTKHDGRGKTRFVFSRVGRKNLTTMMMIFFFFFVWVRERVFRDDDDDDYI